MLEWTASVRIATDPVIVPAITFSRISTELETTDSAAVRCLVPTARCSSSPAAHHAAPLLHASSAAHRAPAVADPSFSSSVSSAIVRPSKSPSGRNAGS